MSMLVNAGRLVNIVYNLRKVCISQGYLHSFCVHLLILSNKLEQVLLFAVREIVKVKNVTGVVAEIERIDVIETKIETRKTETGYVHSPSYE